MEDDHDHEIQEVDPPPKTTRSRGGSRKPSSTVDAKPTTNGTAAKGKPRGKPRSAPKAVREPMDVDSNDAVEHEIDVNVDDTPTVADAINAALKNNAGRAPKSQSGQENEDGTAAQLKEQLRQVRFSPKPNCRLCLLLLLSSQS